MTPHAVLFWTTLDGREGWFLRDGEPHRPGTPVYPVWGPAELAGDKEIYSSLRDKRNEDALSLARLRGRAIIERRYIDPNLPCKKCGRSVGEDAVSWMERLRKNTGKDRAVQPKVCLSCLWTTLSTMADDEETQDEQPPQP